MMIYVPVACISELAGYGGHVCRVFLLHKWYLERGLLNGLLIAFGMYGWFYMRCDPSETT